MILRRLKDSRFSEILPFWKGRTVAILAGGPSLTKDQVSLIEKRHAEKALHCIAVNDAYLLAPFADIAYAADKRWHGWHEAGIGRPVLGLKAGDVQRLWKTFAGQKCGIESSGEQVQDEAVHLLRNAHGSIHGFGLSEDATMLVTGRNSGFQALNLASLSGAKRVILLGFDGQPEKSTGATHWFGGHPSPTPQAAYALYRQAMSAAEESLRRLEVEVINCSPGSAIDSFPKRSIEEVL